MLPADGAAVFFQNNRLQANRSPSNFATAGSEFEKKDTGIGGIVPLCLHKENENEKITGREILWATRGGRNS